MASEPLAQRRNVQGVRLGVLRDEDFKRVTDQRGILPLHLVFGDVDDAVQVGNARRFARDFAEAFLQRRARPDVREAELRERRRFRARCRRERLETTALNVARRSTAEKLADALVERRKILIGHGGIVAV